MGPPRPLARVHEAVRNICRGQQNLHQYKLVGMNRAFVLPDRFSRTICFEVYRADLNYCREFDKWYEFASSREFPVIDDCGHIRTNVLVLWAFNSQQLREIKLETVTSGR